MAQAPDLSKMTDEELEIYYFQVHDTDKNSKLDGLEMLQAIFHTTHDDRAEDEETTQDFKDDFEYYVGKYSFLFRIYISNISFFIYRINRPCFKRRRRG